MTYRVIGTGSKGNAVVINDVILIDCGVPYKKIASGAPGISHCLLTHRHGDHFKPAAVRKLAWERPSLIFVCCDYMVKDLIDCGVPAENIETVEIGNLVLLGDFTVCAVQLYHDVPNCGWRIFMNDERLFYATDTYTLEGITAKDYDLYMIEANFEDDEIKERIRRKEKNGEYAYERKAMHNHLSKAKCDDFIYANAGRKSEYVYLHQHEGG